MAGHCRLASVHPATRSLQASETGRREADPCLDKTTPGSHHIGFGQTRAWQPPVCLNETTLAAVWSRNERQRTKCEPVATAGPARPEAGWRTRHGCWGALGVGEGSQDAGSGAAEPSGLGPGDREDGRPLAWTGQPEEGVGREEESDVQGSWCLVSGRTGRRRKHRQGKEKQGTGLRVGGRRAGRGRGWEQHSGGSEGQGRPSSRGGSFWKKGVQPAVCRATKTCPPS